MWLFSCMASSWRDKIRKEGEKFDGIRGVLMMRAFLIWGYSAAGGGSDEVVGEDFVFGEGGGEGGRCVAEVGAGEDGGFGAEVV